MIKISDEHLKELEAEAIFVMREVAAQFENKVLLFSGGKDSIVLVHLARKAFWPARIPFSLLHIVCCMLKGFFPPLSAPCPVPHALRHYLL